MSLFSPALSQHSLVWSCVTAISLASVIQDKPLLQWTQHPSRTHTGVLLYDMCMSSSSFLTTDFLLHHPNHSFSITPEALVLVLWEVKSWNHEQGMSCYCCTPWYIIYMIIVSDQMLTAPFILQASEGPGHQHHSSLAVSCWEHPVQAGRWEDFASLS